LEGANNIAKNALGKGLTQTPNILRRNQHTNIIVINVPQRFDRNEKSCIHVKVKGYDRKMSEIIKKFDNVLLMRYLIHIFSLSMICI